MARKYQVYSKWKYLQHGCKRLQSYFRLLFLCVHIPNQFPITLSNTCSAKRRKPEYTTTGSVWWLCIFGYSPSNQKNFNILKSRRLEFDALSINTGRIQFGKYGKCRLKVHLVSFISSPRFVLSHPYCWWGFLIFPWNPFWYFCPWTFSGFGTKNVTWIVIYRERTLFEIIRLAKLTEISYEYMLASQADESGRNSDV